MKPMRIGPEVVLQGFRDWVVAARLYLSDCGPDAARLAADMAGQLDAVQSLYQAVGPGATPALSAALIAILDALLAEWQQRWSALGLGVKA